MPRDAAYHTVARHVFVTHRKALTDRRQVVTLADSLDEADEEAKAAFGMPSVHVKRVIPTEDTQIYNL